MPLDFARSFMSWETDCGSLGRFNVEAYLKYKGEEWFLGSDVMACDVYGEKQLFKEPAYSFQPLFSTSEYKIFRTYHDSRKTDDSSSATTAHFKTHAIARQELAYYRECDFSDEVDLSLNYQAVVTFDDHELQFPVKHLNYKKQTKQFQVETGPLVFPYGNELLTGFITFNDNGSFEALVFETPQGNRRSKVVAAQKANITFITTTA